MKKRVTFSTYFKSQFLHLIRMKSRTYIKNLRHALLHLYLISTLNEFEWLDETLTEISIEKKCLKKNKISISTNHNIHEFSMHLDLFYTYR